MMQDYSQAPNAGMKAFKDRTWHYWTITNRQKHIGGTTWTLRAEVTNFMSHVHLNSNFIKTRWSETGRNVNGAYSLGREHIVNKCKHNVIIKNVEILFEGAYFTIRIYCVMWYNPSIFLHNIWACKSVVDLFLVRWSRGYVLIHLVIVI